jgi:hypothetical protein
MHCGYQTCLVKDMLGSCHLKVSPRVMGPQSPDKKSKEIAHGGGLSRAAGRVALPSLGPELMSTWVKPGEEILGLSLLPETWNRH